MTSELQSSAEDAPSIGQESGTDSSVGSSASGDELVNELGRLGRKLIEVLETAWNSDQRRQIEQDLRSGLGNVADSLEAGLKDFSEQERTKEFIGKAETMADNVGEKVRTSDAANELAKGLATGLHALADQLDRLAGEMRDAQARKAADRTASPGETEQGQDIPISREPPAGSGT